MTQEAKRGVELLSRCSPIAQQQFLGIGFSRDVVGVNVKEKVPLQLVLECG